MEETNRVAVANVFARMRMTVNYFAANSLNYLAAGTEDRSEILMGYFTKYGDGGADFLPIGHLYKTEVRELATYLHVPSRIVRKPSSPQ
jgi:NAD+ synthase